MCLKSFSLSNFQNDMHGVMIIFMLHPPYPSRASTALRVTFRVSPSLQPHMEVLPKYGVVQGESSYSAQLKFTPKASILEWEGLTEEGALIMPVEVHVVDQVRDLKHDTLLLTVNNFFA